MNSTKIAHRCCHCACLFVCCHCTVGLNPQKVVLFFFRIVPLTQNLCSEAENTKSDVRGSNQLHM